MIQHETHTYLCTMWLHGILDPRVREALAFYGWGFVPAHIVDINYDGQDIQRTHAMIRVSAISAAFAESACRNNLRGQGIDANVCVTQVGP